MYSLILMTAMVSGPEVPGGPLHLRGGCSGRPERVHLNLNLKGQGCNGMMHLKGQGCNGGNVSQGCSGGSLQYKPPVAVIVPSTVTSPVPSPVPVATTKTETTTKVTKIETTVVAPVVAVKEKSIVVGKKHIRTFLARFNGC